MKHFLLLFLILLTTGVLWSQDQENAVISLSANSFDSSFVVDITNPDLDLGISSVLTNNTDQEVDIYWNRVQTEKPDSWETYICIDGVLCYSPVNDTNYDPDNGINEPLKLKAGETLDFALHLLPNQVEGDGTFEATLALGSKPDSVIAKINYNVNIRDQERTTGTFALTAAEIRIFPNPATEYFMLSEYSQLSRVDIYSMLGRRMRSYEIIDDRSLSLSGLPDGLYLISLVDRNGRIVRTSRLIKKAFRP